MSFQGVTSHAWNLEACEPVYKSDSLKSSDETEGRVCETERERETKREIGEKGTPEAAVDCMT